MWIEGLFIATPAAVGNGWSSGAYGRAGATKHLPPYIRNLPVDCRKPNPIKCKKNELAHLQIGLNSFVRRVGRRSIFCCSDDGGVDFSS